MKHTASELQVDIGAATIKVARGDGTTTTIPLERDPAGAPTAASRAAAVDALRAAARDARTARVGLPANGVSIRRFPLPKTGRDTIPRVLSLQMEQSFPIAPESLAWSYRLLEQAGTNGQAGKTVSTAVVVAVRRDRLDAYDAMLRDAGLEPRFTVGALAAAALLPARDGVRSVVDVGAHHTELLTLRDGQPESLRTIPWGGDRVTAAIAQATGTTPAVAEAGKSAWDGRADAPDRDATSRAVHDEVTAFAASVRNALGAPPETGVHHVHLAGGVASTPGLDRVLADTLGRGFDVHPTLGGSDAVARGLARLDASSPEDRFDFLTREESASMRPVERAPARLWPWAVAAVVLVAALLALRYLPATLGIDGLKAELARSEAALADMPAVDRELAFLRHVGDAQPPTWEAIAALAHVAPQGAVLKVLRIKRNGAVDLEVQIKPGENAALRTRLVRTGWFSALRYEGQKTVKGHDKKPRSIVRYTARLTPPANGLDAIADDIKTAIPDPADVKTQSAQPGSGRSSRSRSRPQLTRGRTKSVTPKGSSKAPTAVVPGGAKATPKVAPKSVVLPGLVPSSGPGGLEGRISGLENVPEEQREKILEALRKQMENR